MKYLILLLLAGSCAATTTYPCTTSDGGTTCTISGLRLNRDDYDFVPTASNPEAVTKFILSGSTVPIITNSICKTFPNLMKFDAQRDSIEEVREDAFHDCPNLNYIDFDYNRITDLKEKTFSNLTKLATLYVYEAEIPFISVNLFADLISLKDLLFRRSGVTELPAEGFRNLKSLETLSIYSNNLFDLEIENILKYTPRLNKIRLNDNYFMCSRLKEIVSALRAKDISIEIDTTSRDRSNYPERYNGIYCLTDVQWKGKMFETAFHYPSSKFMEKLPFGQTILNATTEIEILKSSFGFFNDTIEEFVKSQKDHLRSEMEKFNKSTQENLSSISDMIKTQNDTLGTVKVTIGVVNKDLQESATDIKNFKTNTNDKLETVSQLLNKLSDNIEKLHEYQTNQEVQKSHITGLWIIISLFIIFGLLIIGIYGVRGYRRSRVYNSSPVRFKDGILRTDEDD